MNLITKSAFAKIINVSAAYIGKIADAQLTLIDDGKSKKLKVDLHGVATLRFLENRETNIPADQPTAPTEKPPATKPKPTTTSGNNPSGLALTGQSKKLSDIKLEEQIEKLKIENQQKRGDLIEKILIKKLFGRMYEIDQNQFKTINVSITPKISAAYNAANTSKSKAIIELIKEECDVKPDRLKELKSEINKTLEAGEPDRILEMNKILEDATGVILENIQRQIDEFINMIEEEGE